MKHPKDTKRAEGALGALTASAMALPGLAPAALADGPVEETSWDNEYSYYREDGLRPSKGVPGADNDRMEIHSYQFRVATPVGERSDLTVNGTYESLSGASPWFVLPDPVDGTPIQVMSGSTIDEKRGDMLATGAYYFDQGSINASGGFSIETDYYSGNIGLGAERSFNDKNTTLSIGASASFDWIRPTDCNEFDRICSEDKQSVNAFAGISQILTRHSAIQSTLGFGYSDGFLSDPYKRAYIDSIGSTIRDSRPDDRKQFTWTTKYRHHVSGFNGTAHIDYKLYVDDWGINSHTLDLAWYQSIPWQVQIVPSFRYYSQSQADFYEVLYQTPRNDGNASSDFRLSPYGAITYGLKLTKDVEDWPGHLDWQFALSYERYESDSGLAFQSVDVENPGLVSFRIFAARISVKF